MPVAYQSPGENRVRLPQGGITHPGGLMGVPEIKIDDPLSRELLKKGESLRIIHDPGGTSKAMAQRIYGRLKDVSVTSAKLDDILESVEMENTDDFVRRVPGGFEVSRWVGGSFKKIFKNESALKTVEGVKAEPATFYAIGWLIEEGFLRRDMVRPGIKPQSQKPNEELLYLQINPHIYVPDWGRDDVAAVTDARASAVGYGMQRRLDTWKLKDEGRSIPEGSEDSHIGARARDILVHLVKKLPHIPLESLVRDIRKHEQAMNRDLSDQNARFLVGMALGRLLAVNKAIIFGKGEDERVELNLGADMPYDRRSEVEGHARKLLDRFKDGASLNTLIRTEGFNNRMTALALGFLMKREVVEIKDVRGEDVVAPKSQIDIDLARLELRSKGNENGDL